MPLIALFFEQNIRMTDSKRKNNIKAASKSYPFQNNLNLPSSETSRKKLILNDPGFGNIFEPCGKWCIMCNFSEKDDAGKTELDRVWKAAEKLFYKGVFRKIICYTPASEISFAENETRAIYWMTDSKRKNNIKAASKSAPSQNNLNLPSTVTSRKKIILQAPGFGGIYEPSGKWIILCNFSEKDDAGRTELDRVWKAAKKLYYKGVFRKIICYTAASEIFFDETRAIYCYIDNYLDVNIVRNSGLEIREKCGIYLHPIYMKTFRKNQNGKVDVFMRYMLCADGDLYGLNKDGNNFGWTMISSKDEQQTLMIHVF